MKNKKIFLLPLVVLMAGCSSAHSFTKLGKNEVLIVGESRFRNTEINNEDTVYLTHPVDPTYNLMTSSYPTELKSYFYNGKYFYFSTNSASTSKVMLGQVKINTLTEYSYLPYGEADSHVAVKKTVTSDTKYDFKGGWVQVTGLTIKHNLNGYFANDDELKSAIPDLYSDLTKLLAGYFYADFFDRKLVSEEIRQYSSTFYYVEKI